MLAAWKFSNESVACDHFLPAMADACATCEDSLKHCANELVEYYHVCFPDAAKMIPQPIEPGTEGPVQLVEFTDLFPGLPLLGTCASLPPAPYLGRRSTARCSAPGRGEEARDSRRARAPARQRDGADEVANRRAQSRQMRRAVVRPAERCSEALRERSENHDIYQGFCAERSAKAQAVPLPAALRKRIDDTACLRRRPSRSEC